MGYNNAINPRPYESHEIEALRRDIAKREETIRYHQQTIVNIKRAIGDDDGSNHEWGDAPKEN